MPTQTGATCVDGRGEEEVHNSDANERAGRGSGGRLLRGRSRRAPLAGTVEAKKTYTIATPAAAGGAGSEDGRATPSLGRGRGRRRRRRKLAAAGAGGEDGRAAPLDVPVAGACSAAAGTGALLAGQFCMPAVKLQFEIKDLKQNYACHRSNRRA